MKLIITLLITCQILLPIAFIVYIWNHRNKSRLEWLCFLLSGGSYLLYTLLLLPADVISYYVRLTLPLLYFLAVLRSATRNNKLKFVPTNPAGQINVTICLLLFCFFGINSAYAYRGYSRRGKPAVKLSFPLRNGTYFIRQGGNSRLLNIHYQDPTQRYGIDIVKLNKLGARASGIFPNDLKKYHIYAEPVYSPCKGTVLMIEDGHDDVNPGGSNIEHPLGNFILIKYRGVKILMAHLLKGSITVSAGDELINGQLIGKVGNSGNSAEPHLYIHAAKDGDPLSPHDGKAVPALYDNRRFPVRNSLIIKR